ncbi:hypothetical protein PCE1_000276 [Barthelona sp. PCE]
MGCGSSKPPHTSRNSIDSPILSSTISLESIKSRKSALAEQLPVAEGPFDGILENLEANDPNLEFIAFSDGLLQVQDIEKLSNALKNNTVVAELSLSNTYINDEHCEILAEVFRSNKAILSLGLSNNFISNKGLRVLAEALIDSNVSLIGMNENIISGSEAGHLFSVLLSENSNISEVWLSGCALTDGFMETFTESCFPALSCLELNNCNLSHKSLELLTRILPFSESLKSLRLESNYFFSVLPQNLDETSTEKANEIEQQMESFRVFCLGLAMETVPLEQLMLKGTRLHDLAFGYIVELWKQKPSLQMLDFADNSLTAVALKYVFRHVKQCPDESLIVDSLNLSNNPLMNDGVKVLAKVLKNEAFQVANLVICDVQMNIDGLSHLTKIFRSTTRMTLISLDISNNSLCNSSFSNIDHSSLEEKIGDFVLSLANQGFLESFFANDCGLNNLSHFAAFLKGCQTLRELSLDDNDFGHALCSSTEFLNALFDGGCMEVLSLNNCGLGDKFLEEFIDYYNALQTDSMLDNNIGFTSSIRIINLSGNAFSSEIVTRFIRCIVGTTVEEVYLDGCYNINDLRNLKQIGDTLLLYANENLSVFSTNNYQIQESSVDEELLADIDAINEKLSHKHPNLFWEFNYESQ